MSKPQTNERHGSYAFETFQKFIDSHLARGHDVRLFLDPHGNSYSILCVTCDPRLTDIVTTATKQLEQVQAHLPHGSAWIMRVTHGRITIAMIIILHELPRGPVV